MNKSVKSDEELLNNGWEELEISSQELVRDQFKIIGRFRKSITENSHGNRDHHYIYYVKMQCIKCGAIIYRSETNYKKFDCRNCKKIQTVQKYVGVKSDRFEILAFDHREDGKNQYFFKVRCLNCGREMIRSYSGIFNNRNKIRGCTFCADKKIRSRDPEAPFHVYEGDYKGSAAKRNLNYDLTSEQFKKLVTQNCYYCGAEPQLYKQYTYTEAYMNGIDRVDSSKGYTLDNCVSCCKLCNQMKMEKPQSVFLNQIKNIYENLINKGSETIEKTSEEDGTE